MKVTSWQAHSVHGFISGSRPRVHQRQPEKIHGAEGEVQQACRRPAGVSAKKLAVRRSRRVLRAVNWTDSVMHKLRSQPAQSADLRNPAAVKQSASRVCLLK